MKLNVVGVKRIVGTAKASGLPFDMCTLFALVPIEQVSNPKVQVTGGGYELVEVSLESAALSAFASLKFPALLELETDSKPRFGKFETVVTGYKPVVAAVAKAG